VPGVSITPDAPLPGVTSDTNGAFAVPVYPGWTGSIYAAFPGKVMIPPAMSFQPVLDNQSNLVFVAAEPQFMRATGALQDGAFKLSWYAINGVWYRISQSTNLVDWAPTSDLWTFGNGTELSQTIPSNNPPEGNFFRVEANAHP
jgi:hypothetical protein